MGGQNILTFSNDNYQPLDQVRVWNSGVLSAIWEFTGIWTIVPYRFKSVDKVEQDHPFEMSNALQHRHSTNVEQEPVTKEIDPYSNQANVCRTMKPERCCAADDNNNLSPN